jgi:hypothetical protein
VTSEFCKNFNAFVFDLFTAILPESSRTGHSSAIPPRISSDSEDEFDQLLFGKRSEHNGFSPHEPNRSRSEVSDNAEVSADDDFQTEPVRMCLLIYLYFELSC